MTTRPKGAGWDVNQYLAVGLCLWFAACDAPGASLSGDAGDLEPPDEICVVRGSIVSAAAEQEVEPAALDTAGTGEQPPAVVPGDPAQSIHVLTDWLLENPNRRVTLSAENIESYYTDRFIAVQQLDDGYAWEVATEVPVAAVVGFSDRHEYVPKVDFEAGEKLYIVAE